MEYYDVLTRRQMYRDFSDAAVEDPALTRILRAATRGPSAGFTQGFDFLVLRNPDALASFWNLATTPDWRAGTETHSGLWKAPVVIIPLANRDAYLERYSQGDKSYTNLDRLENWPVPYWHIDCAFATMLLLGAVVNENLGALFFGLFRNVEAIKEAFDVPVQYQPIGAVALGHPRTNEPSKSASRGRRVSSTQFHLDSFFNGHTFATSEHGN